MATLKQVRDKADAKLVQFWQLLQEKQDNYYAKHGKYFQLLVYPETKVADGIDSDFTLRKPSDEKFALDVNFPWTDKVPFQIKVDEWVGPNGAGYQASVFVEWNGRTFTRSRDSDQNDIGWIEVIEEEIV